MEPYLYAVRICAGPYRAMIKPYRRSACLTKLPHVPLHLLLLSTKKERPQGRESRAKMGRLKALDSPDPVYRTACVCRSCRTGTELSVMRLWLARFKFKIQTFQTSLRLAPPP